MLLPAASKSSLTILLYSGAARRERGVPRSEGSRTPLKQCTLQSKRNRTYAMLVEVRNKIPGCFLRHRRREVPNGVAPWADECDRER